MVQGSLAQTSELKKGILSETRDVQFSETTTAEGSKPKTKNES